MNTASNAVKSGDQNQAMQMMQTVAVLDTALVTVQSMQAGTPELQQIHAGLVEGWTTLNSAISEVTRATDPQQMGPGTLLKLTRAMYSGLSATSEWREELEKIAAANGLQQECAAALQQLEPPAGQ